NGLLRANEYVESAAAEDGGRAGREAQGPDQPGARRRQGPDRQSDGRAAEGAARGQEQDPAREELGGAPHLQEAGRDRPRHGADGDERGGVRSRPAGDGEEADLLQGEAPEARGEGGGDRGEADASRVDRGAVEAAGAAGAAVA